MKKNNGFVLIMALYSMTLLVMIGLSGIYLTIIQLNLSRNYKNQKIAFYNAESGIKIAGYISKEIHSHQKINNYEYLYNPKNWKVIFNNNGTIKDNNGDILNIDIPKINNIYFTGEIKMIVDQNTNDVKYINDLVNKEIFWASINNRDNGRPFYIANIIGYCKKNEIVSSRQKIKVELCPFSKFNLPKAALCLNGTLVSHGTPQSLIGEGLPTNLYPCNAKDIIGTNTSVNNFSGNFNICGMLPCDSNSPDIINNSNPYPVDNLVKILKPYSEIIIDENYEFGQTIDDANRIYFFEGNLTINNLFGYGVIVIDNGNLTIGGGIGWYGLIIVNGNLIMNGGGNNQINGSLIVNGNVTGNGNPDIFYNCDFINNFEKMGKDYKQINWSHLI